jgi:hypothetical protein
MHGVLLHDMAADRARETVDHFVGTLRRGLG